MSLNLVSEVDDRVAVRQVLMSVSDKTGLETFVPGLVAGEGRAEEEEKGRKMQALGAVWGLEEGDQAPTLISNCHLPDAQGSSQ